MIKLDNVSFSYTDTSVFAGCNLTIAENLSVLGKSGCGKTTLLHLISGILKPDSGRITINDMDNAKFRNQIGLVMQKGGVFPYKTVYENLSLGLLQDKQMNSKTKAVADMLGISGLLNKYPSQISGGQMQRVALGRVLCMKPKIILMDEPFSALDEITRQQLQDEILAITQHEKMMMVTVTHSIEEALMLGSRAIVLSAGGTIIKNYDASGFAGRDIRFYEKCIEIKCNIEDELV